MTAPRPSPILDPRLGLLTYEGRPLHDPDEPIVDQGLAFDVETLLSRRSMLRAIGLGGLSAGLASLAACSPSAGSSTSATASAGSTASAASSATSAAASAAAAADCSTVIPEETAGPFPGDGSNGPDVLTQSGVVRSDIRTSFGTSTTTAQGVPLTIRFALLDASKGCAPLADAAVYAWHCDRDGNYSMYSQGVTSENYLRGVQATGADGVATFSSIFPACYQGRWPHIHFEVYRSLDQATTPANRIATSQIALPADICGQVYATDGYGSSQTTFPQVSLQTDMVFSDDAAIHQIGAMSGTIANGLTVELPVPVQTA
jgi:protocatechuate 3,4-dioxygenase beta subunit